MAGEIENVGGPIPLEQAGKWTETYRAQNPKGTKGFLYGGNILKQLLNQSGCDGIRFYNAINDNGERQLAVVDADRNNLTHPIVALLSH